MPATDVLIVGAGPVGQMAALALSQQGLSAIVIDRRVERSLAPRAHAVNPRTLEICDSLGLPGHAVRAAGAPADEAGWVRFMTTLTGAEFGHLPYERQQDDVLDLTPFPLANISQPDFEAAVAGALHRSDNVSVLRGCECTGTEQSAEGVTTTVAMRGVAEPVTITSRYLLAADGANSPLRSALGIELEGLENLQHNMMIHFEADLSEYVEARPGILYFLFGPGTVSALIAYDLARSWVLMHSFDPATETADAFDDAHCRALVEAAVGATLPDLRIHHAGPWSMCAQVAQSYRSGRTFLVGDAAHRFPPTGGLGLNTGVVDAHNIAWKIAAVEKGLAGVDLLDTYEAERRPVAQVNTEQSLTNSARLFELIAALNGPDADAAAERFTAIQQDPEAFPEVAAAVAAQRPHFDSLALQLGYRYDSAAIVDPQPAPCLDDISNYQPSHEAGAHLPHRWVEHQGTTKSLLALLSADGFSLIVGPEATAWAEAAHALDLPVRVLRENHDYDAPDGDWSTRTGLPADGALLLRPDHHICLRCGPPPADCLAALDTALDTILARGRTHHSGEST